MLTGRVRLHLQRHLVAGGGRAGGTGALRGQPGRELHQRGRRRRPGALPAQCDGPLAAERIDPRLGTRRRDHRPARFFWPRRQHCQDPTTLFDVDDPRSCRRETCRPGSRRPTAVSTGHPPAAAAAPSWCAASWRASRPPTPAPSARSPSFSRPAPCAPCTWWAGARRTSCSANSPLTTHGLPVQAGPVEATAIGNVLVQARAMGADLPDLAAMRALVAQTHDLRRYEPEEEEAQRDAAESRLPAELSGGYVARTTSAPDSSGEGDPDAGGADGDLHQRRDVPGHRQGGGTAAATARRRRGLPGAADLLCPADGEHRLPRRGGAGRPQLRRRVRRVRRGGHAVGLVRRVGPPPARDRGPPVRRRRPAAGDRRAVPGGTSCRSSSSTCWASWTSARTSRTP